ncbi:MAG: DNA repair protein RadA [Christensenellaceae bacterium]|nr:DNA repair protein RadA [Christensenellaceae bacterium]
MKEKTKYVCGECGYETVKWMGCCPMCNSWNTLTEVKTTPQGRSRVASQSGSHAVSLGSVDEAATLRIPTGIGELDRVLGGGVVSGSTILIGGDPGIGKSTLLLQAAGLLMAHGTVLYVSGEESKAQLKLRAKRCNVPPELLIMTETSIESIESEVDKLKPRFLVIDSIQTIVNRELPNATGSVTQIKEVTTTLTRIAKQNACAVFIVGHVTKEGSLAGPRMLEHMVDTVLYFEGDRHDALRLLRAVKNRFGSTNEIGIFEMCRDGMKEVENTAGLFVSGGNDIGCAVTCAMEGNRPIPVELQSLLNTSVFANSRRMATGMDTGRLILLLAVLERRAGVRVSDKDVYANAVGGIRVDDRGADLALALAIAGSVFDKALPENCVVIGEISLTGEIRPVDRLHNRVQECARLGYTEAIVPYTTSLKGGMSGMNIHFVRYLRDALLLLN